MPWLRAIKILEVYKFKQVIIKAIIIVFYDLKYL